MDCYLVEKEIFFIGVAIKVGFFDLLKNNFDSYLQMNFFEIVVLVIK